jgi:hypothetical protein
VLADQGNNSVICLPDKVHSAIPIGNTIQRFTTNFNTHLVQFGELSQLRDGPKARIAGPV